MRRSCWAGTEVAGAGTSCERIAGCVYYPYRGSNRARRFCPGSVLSDLSGSVAAVSYDEQLQMHLHLQHGVLTRAQALEFLTPKALQHRLRPGGPWQVLLPGVYLPSTGTPEFASKVMAAQLWAGPGSCITGSAALAFLHVAGRRSAGTVEVLVPHGLRGTSRDYVVVHRTRRMPASLYCDGQIRYAEAQRAVADAARSMRRLSDVRTVVGSAVQQYLCTVGQLTDELRPDRRDRLLRSVIAEVADGIRTAPEGELRQLMRGSGLPQPLYNPSLFIGDSFLAKPDAWWQEAGVAAEMDSKEFHLLPEDWNKTMARGRRMTAAGIAVLHISPSQLREQPQQILAEIAAALRNGRKLAGIRTFPAG